MKIMVLLLGLLTSVVPMCAQTDSSPALPQILTFVAPAYPRLASDGRIMGTTVSRIKVGKDGRVIDATNVKGYQLFVKYVPLALKQWTFSPSEQEHEFEVICKFEFVDPDVCSSNGQPATPETFVSAKLPTEVLVQTTLKCVTVDTTSSDPVQRNAP